MNKIIVAAVAVCIVGCTGKNNSQSRGPASVSHEEVAVGLKELIRRAEQTKVEHGEYRKAAMDFKSCYATIGPEAGKFEVYVARTREPVGVVSNILVDQTKDIKPRNFEVALREALGKCR